MKGGVSIYKAGDYIIYGNKGVCKVDKIGALDVSYMPRDKIFYTLSICYTKGNKIYTPVDNEKVIIRPIITKEESMKLIDNIKNIDELWVANEKKREFVYKEALRKCDCRELIKIIKTIYIRKQSRLKDGKELSAIDTKYLKSAEENLYGELAISLNVDIDSVEESVTSRVNN